MSRAFVCCCLLALLAGSISAGSSWSFYSNDGCSGAPVKVSSTGNITSSGCISSSGIMAIMSLPGSVASTARSNNLTSFSATSRFKSVEVDIVDLQDTTIGFSFYDSPTCEGGIGEATSAIRLGYSQVYGTCMPLEAPRDQNLLRMQRRVSSFLKED